MEERNNDQRLVNGKDLHRKLEAVGWGLFFIWIGVAVLSNVGWGAGLLGVGVITLGAQAARKYFGLVLETFWVGVGSFFFLAGVLELLDFQWGLPPTLCIVAGVALLVTALVGKARDQTGGQNIPCPNKGGATSRPNRNLLPGLLVFLFLVLLASWAMYLSQERPNSLLNWNFYGGTRSISAFAQPGALCSGCHVGGSSDQYRLQIKSTCTTQCHTKEKNP